MNFLTIITIVLAGICGVIASIGAGTVFIAPELAVLLVAFPEIIPVAIVVTAIIPFVYRILPGTRAAVLALFPLTLGAMLVSSTLLLRLSHLGDPHLLALSFVYAITAVLVYHLMLGNRAQRRD